VSIVAAVGISFLVVIVAAWLYNRLVALRQNVRSAWAQIDVQLKRRHELIPNIVSAVKAYMQHEREVLERVTEARSRAIAAGDERSAREGAETALSGALRNIVALVESYPALSASQNVLLLQEELSSTENRIAFARQYFNDSVAAYNTAREKFPANVLAGTLGFAPEAFFRIELSTERDVPVVTIRQH
jgi:LemA protein